MSATARDHVRNVAADNGYERDGDLGEASPWDAFVRNERRVAIKFSRANDRVLKSLSTAPTSAAAMAVRSRPWPAVTATCAEHRPVQEA